MKRLALIFIVFAFVLGFFYLNRNIVNEVEEVQQPVATVTLPQKQPAPAVVVEIPEDWESPLASEPAEEPTLEPESSETQPDSSSASPKIIYETPTNDVILVQ